MTPFQMIAAVVTLSAACSYVNYRYLRFPATVGLMACALALSLVSVVLAQAGVASRETLRLLVAKIDFSEVLLHGMLSFLLFAGAMHINLDDLKKVRWMVAVLATVGVIVATFVTGTLIWYASQVCRSGAAISLCLALRGAHFTHGPDRGSRHSERVGDLETTLYKNWGRESVQ